MFGLGTKELIILAVILVILFGAKKVPELAKSIVQSIRYLRKSFSNDALDGPGDGAEKSS